MSFPDPSDGLNPEQHLAVMHARGPLLVLAGAGSGKTRVVTRRLAQLIQSGADPRTIVAVTFTNKAAGEMRERVRALLGRERLDCFVGTFHAWGLRFLRRHTAAAQRGPGFSIADVGDQIALLREAMEELGLSEQTFPPATVHARISAAKNDMISARRFAETETDFAGTRVAQIYSLYEKKLVAANAVDFDDLLLLPVRALNADRELLAAEQARVVHLLIDEYQDTNRAQDALIKLIGARAASLCAVGDEDQSIYGWRGARVEHILRFEEDFPGATIVALVRNYRSTQKILEVAGAVVAANRHRRPKKLVAQAQAGSAVTVRSFHDGHDEAAWVAETIVSRRRPFSENAVLMRTNAQSREFEDEFMRRGIPYVVIGGMKFYERAEVKDTIAYLRLALNPNDDLAFRRVVNTPARGIGAATLEKLSALARENHESLFESSKREDRVTERARIALGKFRDVIIRAGDKSTEFSPSALLEFILDESGYRSLYLRSDEPADVARRENLKELVSAARQYEAGEEEATARGFLDAVSLTTSTDISGSEGAVSLMTLHCAKGLEFPDVFIAGVEEGFLPHAQSSGSEEEIAEERRLLYVGMTRAREALTLTLVRQRLIYGQTRLREPSRFLDDLPASAIERFDEAPEWSDEPDFSREERDDTDEETFDRRPAAWRGRFGSPGASSGATHRRVNPPGTLPGLPRGGRVSHQKYGSGVILQQEGSGDDARVTVYFDRVGKKKFIAKFANLRPE